MNHRLELIDRRELLICGVTEVDSSEDQKVLLKTVQGAMVVEGENLRILNLDLQQGEAKVAGKVNGIVYKEVGKEKQGRYPRRLGGKLFR